MFRRAAAAFVVLLLTAGCESTVVTRFDPATRPEHVDVTVVLTGAVAEAVDTDSALERQLVAVFTDAAGVAPERVRFETDGERGLRYTARVPIDTVTAAEQLTGVTGLSVAGEDPLTVSVSFVRPSRLIEALEGFSDEAATAVALESTFVMFEVHFPGGVDTVVGDVPYTEDDGTIRVRQPIGSFVPGSLVATGFDSPSRLWMWGAAALVGAGGLLFVFRRRR